MKSLRVLATCLGPPIFALGIAASGLAVAAEFTSTPIPSSLDSLSGFGTYCVLISWAGIFFACSSNAAVQLSPNRLLQEVRWKKLVLLETPASAAIWIVWASPIVVSEFTAGSVGRVLAVLLLGLLKLTAMLSGIALIVYVGPSNWRDFRGRTVTHTDRHAASGEWPTKDLEQELNEGLTDELPDGSLLPHVQPPITGPTVRPPTDLF